MGSLSLTAPLPPPEAPEEGGEGGPAPGFPREHSAPWLAELVAVGALGRGTLVEASHKTQKWINNNAKTHQKQNTAFVKHGSSRGRSGGRKK